LEQQSQFLPKSQRSQGQLVQPTAGAKRTHSPPTQRCCAEQALVQRPQCSMSVAVLAHAPPQAAVPAGHDPAHAPAAQTWPDAQGVPHPPQFIGSEPVSTQAVPQEVSQL
jgi:hypothetical protein